MVSDINLQVLHALLSLTGTHVWVDALIIFFGHYYLFFLIAIALYAILKNFRNRPQTQARANLVGLSATFILIFAVTFAIHSLYPQLRPYLKLGVHNLIDITTSSFPSGHTIFIFGLATVLYFYNKKLSLFMYVSGLIVGVARVAAGVHYPIDILGGAVLGTLIGACTMLTCRRFLDPSQKASR